MGAATTAAAATRTWDGGSAANDNWMTAANWAGDVAPVSGDSLIFPAGVADTVTTNNVPIGTTFETIAFGTAYTVDGNRIVIASIEHSSPNETTINASSRRNFGATITSDRPIAVERAMYNNASGQIWAAGTNATATPLP